MTFLLQGRGDNQTLGALSIEGRVINQRLTIQAFLFPSPKPPSRRGFSRFPALSTVGIVAAIVILWSIDQLNISHRSAITGSESATHHPGIPTESAFISGGNVIKQL